MRCLPELIRRLFAITAMLVGAWMLIWPGSALLSVYVPDFAAQFQRQFAVPGGVRDAEALQRFIEQRSHGRVREVQGHAWRDLQASLADDGRAVFVPTDPPFDRLAPLAAFQYLRVTDNGTWLAVERLWPQELRNTSTPHRYPQQFTGLALIGLALLIYTALPRDSSHGTLRYRSSSAVVLPDLLALFGAPLFAVLPLAIVYHTAPGVSPFDADRGWLWLTLALWLLAAVLLSLLLVGQRYSCLRIRVSDHGIRWEEHFGTTEVSWDQVVACAPYEDATSSRLGRFLMLFGGSLQAVGLGLILQGNNEHGIELTLRDGARRRIMRNALLGEADLLAALRKHGIDGSAGLA